MSKTKYMEEVYERRIAELEMLLRSSESAHKELCEENQSISQRLAITESNLAREKKMFERELGEKQEVINSTIRTLKEIATLYPADLPGKMAAACVAQLTEKESNNKEE